MAYGYADLLPKLYDLLDTQAPPVHAGYIRYSTLSGLQGALKNLGAMRLAMGLPLAQSSAPRGA